MMIQVAEASPSETFRIKYESTNERHVNTSFGFVKSGFTKLEQEQNQENVFEQNTQIWSRIFRMKKFLDVSVSTCVQFLQLVANFIQYQIMKQLKLNVEYKYKELYGFERLFGPTPPFWFGSSDDMLNYIV